MNIYEPNVIGSMNVSGSLSNTTIQKNDSYSGNVVVVNPATGLFYYTNSVTGTGSSGTSGSTGTSGTSGVQGAQGSIGNGTSGTSGTSGAQGAQGVSGAGTSGTSGAQGAQGVSGAGTSGTSGQTGTSGTSGQTGTSGSSGTAGSSGLTNGAQSAITATSTTNFDLNNQLIEITFSASITTITHSNAKASGTVNQLLLVFIADGTARTVAWPSTYKWPGGVAPTMTSTNAKRDIIQLISYDGASTSTGTVHAMVVAQNV